MTSVYICIYYSSAKLPNLNLLTSVNNAMLAILQPYTLGATLPICLLPSMCITFLLKTGIFAFYIYRDQWTLSMTK